MDKFNEIYQKRFATSEKAINFCQSLARYCGFGVRIRTSKLSTIYLVCSREGKPEPKKVNTSGKKRNRNSDRCNCDWRIVLFETEGFWEFRAGKRAQHNHSTAIDEVFETQLKNAKLSNVITPSDYVRLPSIESLLMGKNTYLLNSTPERSTASISPESNDSFYSNTNSFISNTTPLTNALPKINSNDLPFNNQPTSLYAPYPTENCQFNLNPINFNYSVN